MSLKKKKFKINKNQIRKRKQQQKLQIQNLKDKLWKKQKNLLFIITLIEFLETHPTHKLKLRGKSPFYYYYYSLLVICFSHAKLSGIIFCCRRWLLFIGQINKRRKKKFENYNVRVEMTKQNKKKQQEQQQKEKKLRK